MKRIIKCIWVIILLATFNEVQSQRLFIHLDGGAMNYGGDLQDKVFTFNQANSVIGGGLYYNLSDHIAIEGSFSVGKLAASDAKTNTESLRRNLSFYSNIYEGSLLIRANLWNIPADKKFTPYITTGVAFFHFDPYAYTLNGEKVYLRPLGTEGEGLPQYPDRKIYNLNQISIPFGFGVTYAISDNFMLGAEINFRKTFTDYIDDVSSQRYADTAILRASRGDLSAKMSFRSDETSDPYTFSERITRGNPDKKDAYYSCVIKLYISLDNLFSSSSNGSEAKRNRKQMNCPKKVL
jgi:opacity protein-like surface antigen